jgi:serine/threonine-protein kinase
VVLEVSEGPAPITVPDVRYNSGAVAAQLLEEAGFTVSGIDGSPSGMVLATDPPPGEQHPRGTAVRIFTRS